MYYRDLFFRNILKIFQYVILNAFGNSNYSLALRHHGGVGVDRIEAVNGGDQAGARVPGQAFPSEPCEPGRQPRSQVNDVGLFRGEEFSQAWNLAERGERLAVDRHLDMARTGFFQIRDLPSAVGNDEGFMPFTDEMRGDFQGAALDAAGIELGEDLEDFHGGGRREMRGMATCRAALTKALGAALVRM